MRYTCLALDMDGTLLTDDKRISETNRYWLQRAMDAGVHIVLASGRDHRDMVPYYKELGLSTPFVSVNGSEVWKAPNTLSRRALLDGDMVHRLYRVAVEYDAWHWAFGLERVYDKKRWLDDLDAESWMMFCYYSEDEQVRAAISRKIESFGEGKLDITNSNPKYLEVVPKGVSKASGLRKICEMLGTDLSGMIAAGDGLNDLSMIREAGLGIAMGNAQEPVKEAADAVAPSNREDGVAAIIRHYLFGEKSMMRKSG